MRKINSNRQMRIALKIFSFLDLVSLVFMGMQLWTLGHNLELIPDTTLSIVKVFATILLFFSLFVTIWGHFKAAKYSFITYYIQFPVRLLLWVFSIGFITLLPEALNRYEDYWFDWLFRICVLAEFLRLYFTIQFHRNLGR